MKTDWIEFKKGDIVNKGFKIERIQLRITDSYFINNFVVIKYKADIAMQISNVSFVYFNCDYICNNLNTGNPFFSAFQSNISAEQARMSTIVIIHQQ